MKRAHLATPTGNPRNLVPRDDLIAIRKGLRQESYDATETEKTGIAALDRGLGLGREHRPCPIFG